MPRYVALLRGINVGGNNLIKMAALKACFEEQGLIDVATYIQSGNVVFSSASSRTDELARAIEGVLAATFGCKSMVVLRNQKQMKAIVDRAPQGFGTQPARYRYDVIFLNPPLSAATALKSAPVAPGVDEVHPGSGVLYFSRLISKAARSQLRKIISSPIYSSVTIRNWNTTTALLRLMAAGS